MLGKLLKYEFKATARTFLPLYGVLILLAFVNRFFSSIGTFRSSFDAPSAIAMTVFVCILIAIGVLTVVVMIQRFYNNLLTDEGYLMFTLPVRTSSLLWSKLIIATFWIVLSIVIAMFSIFIIVGSPEIIKELWSQIPVLFNKFLQLSGIDKMNGIAFLFETILCMFSSLISGILMVYASIALGHLVPKYRMLSAFGAFILLNILFQTLGSIAINILDPFFNSAFSSGTMDILFLHSIINISSLFFIVASAACFIVTYYILKNRLNIE